MTFLPEAARRPVSGVILLDKPREWTSRRAVNEVARLFGRIKAGHAGTLDPLATGMLPILLGEATRFSGIGLDADKSYEVEMDLSFQTDTLDAEGRITGRFDIEVDRHQLETVLQKLTGDQEQLPPAFSAIRIQGRHAYELARKGRAVALPARRVHIAEMRLLAWEHPRLTLFVRCSKGTYIRALARDLGMQLHAGGCVTALRRLAIGDWQKMVDVEALRQQGREAVMPMAQWLRHLPSVQLEKVTARRFVLGQRLRTELARPQRQVAVFCGAELLGTAEIRQGEDACILQPRRVIPVAREALA